jgi:hypothetical protein
VSPCLDFFYLKFLWRRLINVNVPGN